MKPHDDLFREMVSDPAAQRDMIQISLPDLAGRIDLDSVTPVDATFTGGKQADLLLSMRERGDVDRRGREHFVYMLVEHKTSLTLSIASWTSVRFNLSDCGLPPEPWHFSSRCATFFVGWNSQPPDNW